jgi:hypothetical protein
VTVKNATFRDVALVESDVSEELSASIRVTRIGELGTTLAVTSNRRTLRKKYKAQVFLNLRRNVFPVRY